MAQRNKRERVSRKLERFHCHLASHLLVLKRHLVAFRGERGKAEDVYLHKCSLETKSIVVGFAVCQVCCCFSEEGAMLLITRFLPSLLIKTLHKASNYRANVLLESRLGKWCLCGCWLPKIDVDFYCVYSIKTATAAVGEFQHRDFCHASTLHKHNKKISKTSQRIDL